MDAATLPTLTLVSVICPKCQNVMTTFEREGLHIEKCEGCRGIFLDRGELEQIIAAERRHYTAGPPPYQPEPYGAPPVSHAPPTHRGRPDSPSPYRGDRHYDRGGWGGYRDSPPPYYHKRKKRSFLEGLFD